jgi:hypothetical protein
MFNPSSGTMKDRLLRYSSMEGHTQWISDDDQDDPLMRRNWLYPNGIMWKKNLERRLWDGKEVSFPLVTG